MTQETSSDRSDAVSESTAAEAFAAFDFTCRHYLNRSAEDFLHDYDAGKITGNGDFRLNRVLDMLPLVR